MIPRATIYRRRYEHLCDARTALAGTVGSLILGGSMRAMPFAAAESALGAGGASPRSSGRNAWCFTSSSETATARCEALPSRSKLAGGPRANRGRDRARAPRGEGVGRFEPRDRRPGDRAAPPYGRCGLRAVCFCIPPGRRRGPTGGGDSAAQGAQTTRSRVADADRTASILTTTPEVTPGGGYVSASYISRCSGGGR